MENLSSHFQGLTGGGILSVIAFSVVFLALAGLCLIIYGVKFLAAAVDNSARAKGNAKAAKADAPKGTPVAQSVSVQPPSAAAVASGEDENLLAVIGAVIASTLGGGFAVRSVRPVSTVASSACGMWKGSSRIEAMEGF